MNRWLSLFLFAFPLFATVNEALRCEVGSGYRNDFFHWHLKNGGLLTYTEKYRNVQFWENDLTLKAIHRDLAFLVQGGYGAFGRGALTQQFSNLSFATNQPSFLFSTNGWAAYGLGYFGYAVNLTAERTYKVVLTPLVGFSAHYFRQSSTDPRPNPLTSRQVVGGNFYTLSSRIPSQEQLSWYGFFLGGGLKIQPGGRLIFDLGYTYHWIHGRLRASFQRTQSIFLDGPILTSSQIVNFSFVGSAGGNHGQSGWARFDYILNPRWRVGIGGGIHYFFSRVWNVTASQTVLGVTTKSTQQLKMRWTSLFGLLNVSREF